MSEYKDKTLVPSRLIAQCWNQAPRGVTSSARSGVSAALWEQELTSSRTIERPGIAEFHILTMKLRPYRVECRQDSRRLAWTSGATDELTLALPGMGMRATIHQSWRALQLYLPNRLVANIAADCATPLSALDALAGRHFRNPVLKQIGRLIAADIDRGDISSELRLDALATIACIELLRLGEGTSRDDTGAIRSLADWQVRRAIDYMTDRLDENVTLAAVASTIGISRYHFAHGFKQATGLSPYRYLLLCRIERAKQLLVTTKVPITEIAVQVGYNDSSQLSRLFRSELGISPSAFRRTAEQGRRRAKP